MMTMASSQRPEHKESQGFTLLQEDSLDDRPSPAVKKFVASVLNRKDLRDQDVASSYRSLVEYRDGCRSPTHGFNPISEGDGLGLLSPPSSPTLPTTTSREREERLPNKLLDELCEDMGMKSGDQVDLDFVEFLMEQGEGSHSFMTPEGLNGGSLQPSGDSGGNVSAASSNISTPSNGSGCGFVASAIHGTECPSSAQTGSGVPGVTTALSSTSNSPVRKRIHLSVSEQSSPGQLQHQQQQQQQKQQYYQPPVPGSRTLHSPCCMGQEFKLPPTPLTPAQTDSGAQDFPAKGHDSGVNVSTNMSGVSAQTRASFSPRQTGVVTEGLETVSCGSGYSGGAVSTQSQRPSCKSSVSGSGSYSPAVQMPLSHPIPQLSSVDHAHRGMMGKGQIDTHNRHLHHHHHYQHNQYAPQLTDVQYHSGMSSKRYQQISRTLYHKPYKQPSHTVNTGNFPPVRWRFPGVAPPAQKQQHQEELGKPSYLHPPRETHGSEPVQNIGYGPSESDRHKNTSCAPSGTLPSFTSCGDSTVSASKPQVAHDCDGSHSEGRFFNGMSHSGPLSRVKHTMMGTKDSRVHTHNSCDQYQTDSVSATGNHHTQTRKRMNRYEDSNIAARPQTVSNKCPVTDPALSDSFDFDRQSNYSMGPLAGCNVADQTDDRVSGVTCSNSLLSCDYAGSSHIGKKVNSDIFGSADNLQCQTNFSNPHSQTNFRVSQDVNRFSQNRLHVNDDHQQSRIMFEGSQGVHRSTQSSQQMNSSLTGHHPSAISHSLYTSDTTPCPHRVNQMHGAVQQQGLSSNDTNRLQQQNKGQLPLKQMPLAQQQSHQQHCRLDVDGYGGEGYHTLSAPVAPSHTSHTLQNSGRSSMQSDVQDSFSAQSESNLCPVTNCQQDMRLNMQGDINMSVTADQDMNINTMTKHQSTMGPGAGNRMLPPPSPAGFRPSAVSTPVSSVQHRTKPPSFSHRYRNVSERCQQAVNRQYPAGSKGSVPMLQHYDSVMSPTGDSCPDPYRGRSFHSPGLAPHSAQMKPPSSHSTQMQQPPYALPTQMQQFVPSQPLQSQQSSFSHPVQSQSPPLSQHVQSVQCAPSRSQEPVSSHSQHLVSSRLVQSQQLSSSYHVQPRHAASPVPIQSQDHSHQPAQTQRLSSPQTSHIADICPDGNTTACGRGHIGPASKAFSSKQKFIQNLIMDEGNAAYRSHPLFPLLRDLVIAGMNFDDPRFHYQPLLCMLPHNFDKLLQNFLQRNPPSGDYQSNFAVESVLMDSLRLAHASLVEKICARQEQEQSKAMMSSSVQGIDEFCDRFDQTRMGPWSGVVNGHHPTAGTQRTDMLMQHPLHIMTSLEGQTKVMVALNEGDFMGPVVLQTWNGAGDMLGSEGTPGVGTPKPESKKHPNLPKEAVSRMLDWLKEHKDNPYPNDEEKTCLIKKTGLTINQINYWFTNARRRILPKWSRASDSPS